MRRRGTFFVMWLVLVATLQAAFFPLLHDHAHGHGKPTQQVAALVQQVVAADTEAALAAATTATALQPGAGGSAAAHGNADPDLDPDACAVCAHFAGTCFSLLTRYDAAFVPVRAPPPLAVAQTLPPLQLAWLLPASRAPPSLSTVTPTFAA
ncbi:MAG: hypothetical protein EOO33_11675 [Comamonadaceae bacterium]|nr:MAG: hypothetical protein EOO33_11675 [Comamonadaceae bacterium]